MLLLCSLTKSFSYAMCPRWHSISAPSLSVTLSPRMRPRASYPQDGKLRWTSGIFGRYREVKIIKETAAAAKQKPSDAVAIVSYDEKPGIQAIATTAPDLRIPSYSRRRSPCLAPRSASLWRLRNSAARSRCAWHNSLVEMATWRARQNRSGAGGGAGAAAGDTVVPPRP
jgi:hypothetical protein